MIITAKHQEIQTCGVICRVRKDFNDPFNRSNIDKSVGAFSCASSFEKKLPSKSNKTGQIFETIIARSI